MPISPKRRALYPPSWPAISKFIRFGRARARCECTGECGDHHPTGRCEERHGQMAFSFRGRVSLAAAHLDHDPTHNTPANLKALCQRCHIRVDRWHQAASRRRTRRRQWGAGAVQLTLALPLPGIVPLVGGAQLDLLEAAGLR